MIPVVNLRKKVDLGALLRANAVTIMFIVLCVVCLYFSGLTVPIASFIGYLIGKLLNKKKGQEMIGGLILGYFANGL